MATIGRTSTSRSERFVAALLATLLLLLAGAESQAAPAFPPERDRPLLREMAETYVEQMSESHCCRAKIDSLIVLSVVRNVPAAALAGAGLLGTDAQFCPHADSLQAWADKYDRYAAKARRMGLYDQAMLYGAVKLELLVDARGFEISRTAYEQLLDEATRRGNEDVRRYVTLTLWMHTAGTSDALYGDALAKDYSDSSKVCDYYYAVYHMGLGDVAVNRNNPVEALRQYEKAAIFLDWLGSPDFSSYCYFRRDLCRAVTGQNPDQSLASANQNFGRLQKSQPVAWLRDAGGLFAIEKSLGHQDQSAAHANAFLAEIDSVVAAHTRGLTVFVNSPDSELGANVRNLEQLKANYRLQPLSILLDTHEAGGELSRQIDVQKDLVNACRTLQNLDLQVVCEMRLLGSVTLAGDLAYGEDLIREITESYHRVTLDGSAIAIAMTITETIYTSYYEILTRNPLLANKLVLMLNDSLERAEKSQQWESVFGLNLRKTLYAFYVLTDFKQAAAAYEAAKQAEAKLDTTPSFSLTEELAPVIFRLKGDKEMFRFFQSQMREMVASGFCALALAKCIEPSVAWAEDLANRQAFAELEVELSSLSSCIATHPDTQERDEQYLALVLMHSSYARLWNSDPLTEAALHQQAKQLEALRDLVLARPNGWLVLPYCRWAGAIMDLCYGRESDNLELASDRRILQSCLLGLSERATLRARDYALLAAMDQLDGNMERSHSLMTMAIANAAGSEKAQYCLTQARNYGIAAEWAQGILSAESGLDAAIGAADSSSTFEIQSWLANASARIGDRGQSMEYCERALAMALACDDFAGGERLARTSMVEYSRVGPSPAVDELYDLYAQCVERLNDPFASAWLHLLKYQYKSQGRHSAVAAEQFFVSGLRDILGTRRDIQQSDFAAIWPSFAYRLLADSVDGQLVRSPLLADLTESEWQRLRMTWQETTSYSFDNLSRSAQEGHFAEYQNLYLLACEIRAQQGRFLQTDESRSYFALVDTVGAESETQLVVRLLARLRRMREVANEASRFEYGDGSIVARLAAPFAIVTDVPGEGVAVANVAEGDTLLLAVRGGDAAFRPGTQIEVTVPDSGADVSERRSVVLPAINRYSDHPAQEMKILADEMFEFVGRILTLAPNAFDVSGIRDEVKSLACNYPYWYQLYSGRQSNIENLKALTLLELISDRDFTYEAFMGGEYWRPDALEYQLYGSAVSRVNDMVATKMSALGAGEQPQTSWLEEFALATRALSSVRRNWVESGSTSGGDTLTMRTIFSSLDSLTYVARFFVDAAGTSVMFGVAPDTIMVQYLGREDEIAAAYKIARNCLEFGRGHTGNSCDNLLRRLAVAVTAGPLGSYPIDPARRPRVLVIPDGVFKSIPLEILPMGSTSDSARAYLGEAVEFRYASSMRAYYGLCRRESRRIGGKQQILAVSASPDSLQLRRCSDMFGFHNGLKPLVFGDAEVDAIARLSAEHGAIVTSMRASEASESRVLDKCSGEFRYIHIAAHNVAIPDIYGGDAILLGSRGDERGDGLLQAHDVLTAHLASDVVVLSACESARESEGNSDGLGGLARAFIVAGANSVVVSHWPVVDEVAPVFFEEFYEKLLDGQSAPSALMAARAKVRSNPKWDHPYFWGPFTCYGR